jgi:hypothetical protein
MPASTIIECPHCGALVSPGAICEECGGELPEDAPAFTPQRSAEPRTPPDQAAAPGEDSAAPPIHADPFEDEPDYFAEIDRSEPKPRPQRPTPAPAPAQTQAEAVSPPAGDAVPIEIDDEDCPHFRLEFNSARVFLAGWISSFNFRLHPLGKDSRKINAASIEVRVADGSTLRRPIYGIRSQRVQEIDLNFTPKICGYEVSAEVFLQYTHEGRKHRYGGLFKWDCASPEVPSSKVIENLVIKMEDIGADMAAEQNINILKDFRAATPESMAARLKQLKLQAIWKPVPLFDLEDETPPPAAALLDRLTLVGPGRQHIHFLALDEVIIGRHSRACDIIVRPFDPDLTRYCEDVKNATSRVHARIVAGPRGYVVHDGGRDRSASQAPVKPSSYGTYLDNVRIPRGEDLPLPTEKQVGIHLGDPSRGGLAPFALLATTRMDARAGAPACLILKRVDTAPECFVILRTSCPLDALTGGALTGKIRRRQGAFQFENNHAENWLLPGGRIPFCPGWEVRHYRQFDL